MKASLIANVSPHRPVGRPTSYRPEFCARVVELMAEGRSLDGCAHLLGVHPDSLYEWQKRHPEFSEAVRAGRAAATTFWESRLIDVANGAPGNAQAIQWALRNRSRSESGWDNDRQRLEHSGPDGAPMQLEARATVIDVSVLTAVQRQALREALLAVKSAAGR
jgi:hypothetical protein